MEQETESTQQSQDDGRVRWWGVDFTPITHSVTVAGQAMPCTFAILGGPDEDALTAYMARLPLEVPEVPEPQKGLEFFWQLDIADRMAKMRKRSEDCALIALCLLSINGRPFALGWDDKIKEIRSWPDALREQIVAIYTNVIAQAPLVALEQMARDPSFWPAPEMSGAPAQGADIPRA